ncbi:MAG: hypothetical protein NC122_05065 [Faecalibacterium sp.]|nr:hypothetical protein [Ruminococcus sp.]MCM1391868.1 hypothetical protein [Ruminococcus sp.]MCM1485556.1 hypothetical protein [Faecalibacterium sp.]
MKIVIDPFSQKSLKSAIDQIKKYEDFIKKKEQEIINRLASIGATVASINFSRAFYNGINDVQVSVEPCENGAKIVAKGEAVAFIEFGSGARYGGTYPQDEMKLPIDTSAGSWSESELGKGHWDNPNGWWLPKEKGSGHTYGNPPAMAMYQARKEILNQVKKITTEVFSSD